MPVLEVNTVEGITALLQWLAATFNSFFSWLASIISAVASWFVLVLEYLLIRLWNLLVDVIIWGLNAVFWLLGHIVEIPFLILIALASLLPAMPSEIIASAHQYIVPAYNVANRILPISEAIAIASTWFTFYGLMATWRIITFIRGGR